MFGLIPNRPNALMKKTLPKTPIIVLLVNPKEYFFKISPILLAPIIPINILVSEMSEAIKSRDFNVRNPYGLFFLPLFFFELLDRQKVT